MRILRFNEELEQPSLTVKQGWINVKIDNNIGDRVSKYINRLNFNVNQNIISRIKQILISDINDTFYNKITYLILLQYFKEIRDNFDGSPGGFLMENLIAKLLGGERVPGNKLEDIIVNINSVEIGYQVKFYDIRSTIYLKNLCENTIVLVKSKNINKIYIFLITKEFIEEFFVKDTKVIKGKTETKYMISPSKLIENRDKGHNINRRIVNSPNHRIDYVEIDFDNVNSVMENVSDLIKDNIKEVYDNLALLHDGIDSFLIGESNVNEIDEISNKIRVNVDEINRNIPL